MKDQNDTGEPRKSKRQRVPNSFYTEGINELKRQPRPPREQTKNNRKKSRVYQESEDASYLNQYIDEPKSDLNKDSGQWYPCKLPKNGNTVKVQFVIGQPENIANPIKKEESLIKTSKKIDASPDLLLLFQNAIKNVTDQSPANKLTDQQYPVRQARLKPQPLIKTRKADDTEGKITSLQRMEDKLLINHSKLGEVQVEMEASSQSQEQAMDLELVEEYKQKIATCPYFSQLSLFN